MIEELIWTIVRANKDIEENDIGIKPNETYQITDLRPNASINRRSKLLAVLTDNRGKEIIVDTVFLVQNFEFLGKLD